MPEQRDNWLFDNKQANKVVVNSKLFYYNLIVWCQVFLKKKTNFIKLCVILI